MSNNAGGILSQSLSDRQSGDRDFQAVMALDQYTRQENAEKEQAAIQEQQYYQYINEKADGLLGYDKERIQQRASELQRDIRKKIALYGGDRKKFMQNGGHSQLGQYSNQILSSREFTTFRNNKENLTRIMDAQQKGLGHLVMPKDLDSMQNYKENKGGEITFGGMLSEIEMPDPNNYDLGEDIPINDIITHNQNYMKLIGNYAMANPDLPMPPDDVDLKAFAIKMGYGAKGSNREALRAARNFAMKKALQTAKEPKPDKRHIDGLSEMTKVMTAQPKGKRVEDFYDVEGGTYENKNFFREAAKNNKHIKTFVSDEPWSISAKNFNLDEQGWDYTDEGSVFGRMFKDKFKLANATKVLEGFEGTVAEAVLNATMDDNGLLDIEPDQEMYRMDGLQMTGNESLEPGVYKAKYKPVGIATGGLTTNGKGQRQLLMNVLNDNDSVDVKMTKDFVDDLTGNEVKPVMLLALQSEDGNVFYKSINIENPLLRSKITQHGGEAFLLNDEVEANQRQQQEKAVVQQELAQSEEQYQQAAVVIDNVLTSNKSFQAESRDFADVNDPSLNRSAMMKSFYSVVSNFSDPTSLAENFSFSKLFAPELVKEIPDLKKVKAKFQTFGGEHTEDELIDMYLKASNKGEEDPEVIARNTRFGESWKYMLKQYRALN